MRRALLAAAIVLAAAGPQAAAARAAVPDDDTSEAIGPRCVRPVAIPALDNVFDAKWSPDGWRLAVVRYERMPSAENAGGYREREILQMLDLRTGTIRTFGEGTRPQWSASGRYLSYWGFEADYLVVHDGRTPVASLTPSMPEYRWAGDTLVYVEKSTLRAWSGEPTTIRKFDFKEIPHYPVDDMYWSGDGSRFTLAKYDPDRLEPERFIGRTHAGSLEPLELPGALHTEWGPRGTALLVRYPSRIELRDAGGPPFASIPIARGAVHQWGPGGATLMLRSPSGPSGGDGAEDLRIVWPTESVLRLPELGLPRAFSPDGRFYSGTVRTGLHEHRLLVYRCLLLPEEPRADPDRAAYAASLAAAAGRLIRPAQGPIAQFMERSHTGIDVAAAFGSPIVAAADGVVRAAGWIQGGGHRVCLDHAAGLETCYFHTAGPLVAVGERVRRGQPIALIGMSGLTRGPHVHWEARFLGRLVDPLGR